MAESNVAPEPAVDPLITESMRKAAIVWLSDLPGQPPGRSAPAWCVWLEDALYVISGPGEQPVPGLAGAATCTVTGRGDNGARIVRWPARVTRVEPAGEEWERLVGQVAAKRLNLAGEPDPAPRWAADCVLSRLAPAGDPADLPTGSLAAEPPDTPAARRTETPFHLHRVRRRRRG